MGIVMMVVAVFFLTTMNMLVKVIGPSYHPTQITFLRSLIALLLVVPFLLRAGGVSLFRTRRPGLHFIRSVFGTTGNVLFFYAYQYMTVGDVIVISQAVPLFVTILAVLFLAEKVGIRRWVAVSVGFLGVVIAIDPAGDFEAISLVAVAGTCIWACTILLMRKLGETESPYTVTFYFMLLATLITACFQPWVWQPLDARVTVLIIGTGVTGVIGQLLMTASLKYAEASVVSPFNYTGIIWAVAFDLLIWDVIPAWSTVLGAAIITATGIYIFRREAIVRKQREQGDSHPPPTPH